MGVEADSGETEKVIKFSCENNYEVERFFPLRKLR